jgi:hypothetical protein
VVNQGGFDTGIAISNTSTDPIGTPPATGACTLSAFGANAPAPVVIKPIATGTSYTALASDLFPGFSGYMFALCNFQFAHGFAFISDAGARNFATGYLALVVGSGITRPNAVRSESSAH